MEPFRLDPKLERNQIARLQKRKSVRDSRRISSVLAALKAAAQGRENLIPYILAAVKQSATIGEICSTLTDVFGRYRESQIGK
jgi:methylmalonyl-CoA mutase N-terminal domain/subunit